MTDNDYGDWVGRQSSRLEVISDRLLTHFRAVLAGTLGPGEVPPGLHWALVPDVAEPADLGRDGHPRKGLFVPDLDVRGLPLPRRMWAGGEMAFDGALRQGSIVTRDSTIGDITFKTGASGPLGFVTVHHLWKVGGQTRITERQDLVYREEPKPGVTPTPAAAEAWQADAVWHITPDPVLLFRYSAITFNGHRIHYDLPYATGVEGYAGLVVHGPLQALWLLNLATKMLGRLPATFRYRGLSALICGIPVQIEAQHQRDSIALRVRKPDGVVTMQAVATP
jgi:3-methylfumaryl-CoA hydratase